MITRHAAIIMGLLFAVALFGQPVEAVRDLVAHCVQESKESSIPITFFYTALMVAQKEQTEQSINALAKSALLAINHTDPRVGFLTVIRPLAKFVAVYPAQLPDKFLKAFGRYYPYYAGVLMTIFLEAGLPECAAQALNEVARCEELSTATTDLVITAAMTQTAVIAVFNEMRVTEAVKLFVASPYKFCDRTYSYAYGGVLHLLVPFALGSTGDDMPAAVEPGMAAFAHGLVEVIKKEKPELLVVKNDKGQTARECLAAAIEQEKKTRPVAAHLLIDIEELL